jgi:hypothetical protein
MKLLPPSPPGLMAMSSEIMAISMASASLSEEIKTKFSATAGIMKTLR